MFEWLLSYFFPGWCWLDGSKSGGDMVLVTLLVVVVVEVFVLVTIVRVLKLISHSNPLIEMRGRS